MYLGVIDALVYIYARRFHNGERHTYIYTTMRAQVQKFYDEWQAHESEGGQVRKLHTELLGNVCTRSS